MPEVKKNYFIYLEANEGDQKRSFAIGADGTFYIDRGITSNLGKIQEHARKMHVLMIQKRKE